MAVLFKYGRKKLSALHTKGMFILVLLLIAESVTISNAVKLWSSLEGRMPNNDFITRKKASKENNNSMECRSDDVTGSTGLCTPVGGGSPFLQHVKSSLFKSSNSKNARHFSKDCCRECSNCMSQDDIMKQCGYIPRGGHSHHHSGVADAVAEAAGSTVTPYGIPLHLWKVFFQFLLTSLNVICWLIPLRSKKMSENKLGLSIANAFSGGVFLSLAFGHLIPECAHGFAGYNEATPYLLVMTGYLVIFFVEKVAFDAHGVLHEMEHGGAGHNHHSHAHGKNDKDANKVIANGEASHGQGGGGVSSRSAIILLAALAIHSILEMAALGLADTFADSALLTMSIALHQPAESIALLVAFLKSGMPKAQILQFLSIFSAMGPIGVMLGMAVNEFATPIVDAAMIAIVAGTFIYVGATEVIPEEWEDSEHKWKKFGALMSGIITILVITQYTMTLGV